MDVSENLRTLEESLWKADTRFDNSYMEKILAPDFFEFGRSGRVYKREETLGHPHEEINAKLSNFQTHTLDENVVLVTYISEATYADNEVEVGNRSSLWLKTPTGWQLKFHQGTVVSA